MTDCIGTTGENGMAAWRPEIVSGSRPVYERLADALERDVTTGRLTQGARLPPHRELAYTLGVGVGTVTRAYVEAERRGLIIAHVGRGSFVSTRQAQTLPGDAAAGDTMVDLARNMPPAAATATEIAEALGRLRPHPDIDACARYGPAEGLERVRQAGAEWLRRRYGVERGAVDLIQCAGGQQGIALAFGALCRPGDTILCEASTFLGIKAAAEYFSCACHGVAMDGQGLSPEALDRAAATTGAKAVVLQPTLHNPTTRTMTVARRREVVEVARRRNLAIIEDAAYEAYADPQRRAPSLVDLAPERTFYMFSTSKALATGLRVGFILPPDPVGRGGVLRGVRAMGHSPPGLEALVFAAWVEDGTADAIADRILAEADARLEIARGILGRLIEVPGGPHTPHVWLPMPALEAERLAARAFRRGVEVTPPDAPTAAPCDASGVRLCLGATADRGVLEQALTTVASILANGAPADDRAIV
jgi:DNA-binding transcriptional MocR family regulator